MMEVLIIGAGSIGQALAKCLRKKDISLSLWDKEPSKNFPSHQSIVDMAQQAQIVFLCIPSSEVEKVLRSIRGWTQEEVVIVCLSKGMNDTGETMYELLRRYYGFEQVALLVGATPSWQIMAGRKVTGVFSSKTEDLFFRVRNIFGPKFMLEYNDDIIGCAYASVLKNIYTLGFGVFYTLKPGKSKQERFYQKATEEMTEIICRFGGRAQTASGQAGLEDLKETSSSLNSHNLKNGLTLAKNETLGETEGARSVKILFQHYPYLCQYHLINQIYRACQTNRSENLKKYLSKL